MAQVARESGFEVVVATRLGAGASQFTDKGFRVVPVDGRRGSLSLLQGKREFVQAFRIVRAERPDIVHCISLRPIVIGGVAAKLAGARQIILAPTGLGHLWIEQKPSAVIIRKLVRSVIRWLRGPRTHFLFENGDDPGELGLDPNSSEVSIVGGAGVDPNQFALAPQPPEPPVKIAVVARMIAPKGIAEAVAAVQQVRAAGMSVELHLFGAPDPANRQSIPEQKLLQWSRQPGIAWHGHTADVAGIWRQHHIAMLLSSYREGLPRALVEAAATGRPIVTTNVPGCREVVRDGQEGILVSPGDVEAAARALMRLSEDRGLRERMGAAAYARFRERFTVDAVKQTVRKLYQSLGVMSDARG